MLGWNESERDRKENMGSECRYEDLLREASDGLHVHGISICSAAASRPGQLRCAACEDCTFKCEPCFNCTLAVSSVAHVLFVIIDLQHLVSWHRSQVCWMYRFVQPQSHPLTIVHQASICPAITVQINRHCHISNILVINLQKVTSRQINQNEAHPPPRRHDGALLRPRARRPKQGPIEIRQERGKVKGPGSVS